MMNIVLMNEALAASRRGCYQSSLRLHLFLCLRSSLFPQENLQMETGNLGSVFPDKFFSSAGTRPKVNKRSTCAAWQHRLAAAANSIVHFIFLSVCSSQNSLAGIS
jgi:hypothetical protein